MKKHLIAALITPLLAALSTCVSAENGEPAQMPLIAKYAGPYNATVIYKFADYGEGVACYVYAPKTVSYNMSRDGLSIDNNNIGSISCVKVIETAPSKPKK